MLQIMLGDDMIDCIHDAWGQMVALLPIDTVKTLSFT